MNEKELKNYLKNNIINLNHRDFDLSTLPMGKVQNIRVKVGRKIYLMDADKSALDITIDIYNQIGKVRNAFSKYSEQADLKSLRLVKNCLLSRDLVENFAELQKAIELVKKYKSDLDLGW
jgi:hypothetical protein